MPQVPYNPVPTLGPPGRQLIPGTGAGPIHVETPRIGPEAWGANVGAALQHLGTVTESTGKELFARAEAFQTLDNNNDAMNASVDFDRAAGQMREDLKQKEGQNAVEAYKTYPDELEAKRQEIKATLKNPDAQRQFDIMTRRQAAAAIIEGGAYAGNQHKVYRDASAQSFLAMNMRNVNISPTEADTLDKAKARIYDLTHQYYAGQLGNDGKGWDDQAISQKQFENWSTALGGALVKLGQEDPTTALRYLEARQNDLTRNDYSDARTKIQNRAYQSIPRGVMSDLTTGRVQFLGDKKVSPERAADAIGGFESTNNYTQKTDSGSPRCGIALGRYQVCSNYLDDYLKKAGMPHMTADEFLKDQAAQDQVFRIDFNKMQDEFGSFNEAASRWLTGRSIADARAHAVHDRFQTTVDKYLANTNARLAKTAPALELSAAAQRQGQVLDPDNQFPLLSQALDQAAHAQITRNAQQKTEIAADYRHTVGKALTTPDKDGKYIQNKDELWKDPAVKRAYDNLSEPEREAVERHLTTNIRQGYELTEAKQARYTELLGMLRTTAGRQKFQDEVNLLDERLPNNMTDDLLKRWHEVKGSTKDDPSVANINRAYGDIMDSLGIKRKPGHEDANYWQFVEQAQGAWDAHTEEYGKPPNDQEKQKIAAKLIQQRAQQFRPLGIPTPFMSHQYMYRDIPKEDTKRITGELTKQYDGAIPSPRQVEREYARQLWSEIYEKQGDTLKQKLKKVSGE